MKRMLYLGPSGIGDWCFLYPSFHRLIQAFSIDEVTVGLAYRNAGNELLHKHPLIRRVLYLNRDTSISGRPAYLLRVLSLLWRIRQERYDMVVISYLSNQPDFLLLAIGSGAPLRMGCLLRRSLLERLAVTHEIHSTAMDKVGRHADYVSGRFRKAPVAVPLFGEELFEKASQTVERHGLTPNNYIVLGIGGGRDAGWRFWPGASYGELVRELRHLVFVLAGGGPDDAAQAKKMGPLPPNVVNLVDACGMEEALHLVKHAAMVVGNDSGLTNISATLGVKTLCLYGPTWEKDTGSALLGADVLCEPSCRCRPCFGFDQDPGPAKRCKERRCLSGIPAQRVAARIRKALENRQQPS